MYCFLPLIPSGAKRTKACHHSSLNMFRTEALQNIQLNNEHFVASEGREETYEITDELIAFFLQVYNASIAIPTNILTQISCASSTVCPQNDTIRIQTVFYRNAQLFPVDDTLSQYQVASGVIASKIGKN